MPSKLKPEVRCVVCGKDVAAVVRSWGPISRFEYIHMDEPHQIHTVGLPFEEAKKRAAAEEEQQLIATPGDA